MLSSIAANYRQETFKNGAKGLYDVFVKGGHSFENPFVFSDYKPEQNLDFSAADCCLEEEKEGWSFQKGDDENQPRNHREAN